MGLCVGVMRIVMLCPTAPWPMNSGTRIRQAHLAQALASRHELTVVYFQDEPGEEAVVARLTAWGIRPIPVSARTKERHLTNSHPHPPTRGAPRNEPWLLRGEYSAAFAAAVEQECGRAPVDAVVVARLALLRYVTGVIGPERVVIDLDDVESIKLARMLATLPWGLSRLRRYPDWWRLRRWEDRASACAAATVCSAADAMRLARRGWRQVIVIPNGVDVDALRPLPEPDGAPPTLLFCGLLSYEPNRDAMVWFLRAVWPSIRRQLGAARMLIIGRQPPQELLALHGSDGVVVQGPVEQVEPWYAQSHVAIAPIRAGSGTRLKLLEAFAYGRPAVSTTVGAEGLDVTDGRDIMLADTPSTFAAACVQLLRSRHMRQALGAAGRQLVEARYAWAAIEGQWRQTVEAAVQQRVRA